MQIIDLLTLERTLLAKSINSKKRALEIISNLFAEQLAVDRTELFEAFIERERLGSTAIGHGIALPHIRSQAATQPMGALILFKQPLDFNTPDHEPVKLLFSLIVPDHATTEHLQILAMLAESFSQAEFRERLLSAPDVQTLYQLAIQPHAK